LITFGHASASTQILAGGTSFLNDSKREYSTICLEIAPLKNTIYGIKSCDTMKKARAWLDQRGVDYAFHDYKAVGIDVERLQRWAAQAGWETLLNRSGTTFRNLPDAQKTDLTERKAIALMLAQPSMIKRPVLEIGTTLLVGFKPDAYEKAVVATS
jgi:Spx/MgsR family transcriptional regulator